MATSARSAILARAIMVSVSICEFSLQELMGSAWCCSILVSLTRVEVTGWTPGDCQLLFQLHLHATWLVLCNVARPADAAHSGARSPRRRAAMSITY